MKIIITESQYKKIINESITYKDDYIGSVYGQDSYELKLYLNDDIIGFVKYIIFDGQLRINNIEVKPEFRRQGFGSKMIQYIKTHHPNVEYKPSIKTDLGLVFKPKVVSL